MYEDRSIAWMMSGGNRVETDHQRRDHVHLRALREAQTASASRPLSLRPLLSRAIASVGLGAGGADTTSGLDCCAA